MDSFSTFRTMVTFRCTFHSSSSIFLAPPSTGKYSSSPDSTSGKTFRVFSITVVGIENAHPHAMAELIQFAANWKVITNIETANGNQRISRINQETILNPLYHGKNHLHLLSVEDVLPCDYILLATPALSSPFCPRGGKLIDRSQALAFIDELFHLGRRLRRSKPQSREFARRMTYAWAVSLNLGSGLSGVLATYAIDHFCSGEYDACSAWDRNRPIQKDQDVTGVMVDFTSAFYAR